MELVVEGQRGFAAWLRTGRLPPVRTDQGIELKFNPYHDPHDGRFTAGPGGGGTSGDDAEREIGGEAASSEPESISARGGNSRAFEEPMTLEQAFPGLRGSPAGTAIAVADDVLNITGPANTDFRPSRVVIIRPSQLGADHTYVISRRETKR